jgi:hypothetical protein
MIRLGFCIGSASRHQESYTWKTRQGGRPIDTRPQISDSNIPTGSNIWSQIPKGYSIRRHTDWLTDCRSPSNFDFDSQQDDSDQFRPSTAGKSFKARVSLKKKCAYCITSTNKIAHRLLSRIICVVVVYRAYTNTLHRLHSSSSNPHKAIPVGLWDVKNPRLSAVPWISLHWVTATSAITPLPWSIRHNEELLG